MSGHRRKYQRSRRERRAGRAARETHALEVLHAVAELEARIRAEIDRVLRGPANRSEGPGLQLVSDATVRRILLQTTPVGQRRAMRAQFREVDRRRAAERHRALSPGFTTVIR